MTSKPDTPNTMCMEALQIITQLGLPSSPHHHQDHPLMGCKKVNFATAEFGPPNGVALAAARQRASAVRSLCDGVAAL